MTMASIIWLALVAQEGTLVVESKPPGATVLVDQLEGSWTTPCEVNVPAGRSLEVRISRKGFETVVRRMSVAAGRRASVTFTLAPRAEVRVEAPKPEMDEPVRLRVSSPGGAVRVSSGGRVIAEVEAAAGTPREFRVPPGPIRIDHLQAVGGAPTHTVEILPEGAAGREAGARVGEVQLIHPFYGVYVKLDPGAPLVAGEEIAVFREGREVARSRVLRVIGPDETYPDGAAQVTWPGVEICKGDEARRLK